MHECSRSFVLSSRPNPLPQSYPEHVGVFSLSALPRFSLLLGVCIMVSLFASMELPA